jgi:hypothetical protein
VLAQVWAVGLAPGSAHAARATAAPGPGLIGTVADASADLRRLGADVLPAVQRQTEPVGRLLQERIRAGGLPLPGQAAGLPDAFAIAALLRPAVPSHPRGDGGLSTAAVPERPADRPAAPERPAGSADPAGSTTAQSAVAAADPSARPGGPAHVPAHVPSPVRPAAGSPGDGLAVAPAVAADSDTTVAVLVPIAAGLLLTGVATYKHRGLPRGH